MARRTYTDEERIAALATLAANSGNYRKTARETGISRATLENWQDSELSNAPIIATVKAQVQQSFLEQIREVREAASRRMLELIPTETDLHKVAGALKIANDAARLESGEATQRSEVRTLEQDPERQRLARAAADALNREWEHGSQLN